MFCVPKPDGPPTAEFPDGKPKWRLVLDLTPLNEWCRSHKMKCESLKMLASMGLRADSLMMSFDLQDGFHCVGIDPAYRQYMTFRLWGELIQMASLPFGWSSSPYVFQEVMKVVCKVLRSPDLPSTADLLRARGSAVPVRPQECSLRSAGGPKPHHLHHLRPP